MADSLKSARNVDNGKSARGQLFRPGPYGSKIIRTFIRDGREFQLHATKGWRSYRAGETE